MLTSLRQAIYNSSFEELPSSKHCILMTVFIFTYAFSTADSAHESMTTAGTSGRPTIGLAIAPDDVKKAFGCCSDFC